MIVIISAVLEELNDKWEHYYFHSHVKERGNIDMASWMRIQILQPQDCASVYLPWHNENFLGVCSFFHPSLYFARRCTFWGSRCVKEVEDHDVLVPFVCPAKCLNWFLTPSLLLDRDKSIDFGGSTSQILKTKWSNVRRSSWLWLTWVGRTVASSHLSTWDTDFSLAQYTFTP